MPGDFSVGISKGIPSEIPKIIPIGISEGTHGNLHKRTFQSRGKSWPVLIVSFWAEPLDSAFLRGHKLVSSYVCWYKLCVELPAWKPYGCVGKKLHFTYDKTNLTCSKTHKEDNFRNRQENMYALCYPKSLLLNSNYKFLRKTLFNTFGITSKPPSRNF